MDIEDAKRDLSRAWVLAAIEEYHLIRHGCAPLGTLRSPHFVVQADLTRALGKWHPASRRLVLSSRLFETCDWSLVRQVLKHELAHQLVDEYFGPVDEPPHGPTFERACRVLGIEPGATTRLPPAPGVEHPILRKVEKLMALGDSPNRHEAEQALAKAHELMLRHNLRLLEDVAGSRYGIRWLGPLYRRVPSYVWDIMQILTDFYFVDYICHPYQDLEHPGLDNWRTIELYGTPANLDVAEYVYYFLQHQADTQWHAYRREQGLQGSRQRLSFLRGLYRGVHDRLRAERDLLAGEKALVWVGDPGLKAFYRERNPRVHRTRSTHRFYADAHEAGREAGEQLRIRSGVPANGAASPERLPARQRFIESRRSD